MGYSFSRLAEKRLMENKQMKIANIRRVKTALPVLRHELMSLIGASDFDKALQTIFTLENLGYVQRLTHREVFISKATRETMDEHIVDNAGSIFLQKKNRTGTLYGKIYPDGSYRLTLASLENVTPKGSCLAEVAEFCSHDACVDENEKTLADVLTDLGLFPYILDKQSFFCLTDDEVILQELYGKFEQDVIKIDLESRPAASILDLNFDMLFPGLKEHLTKTLKEMDLGIMQTDNNGVNFIVNTDDLFALRIFVSLDPDDFTPAGNGDIRGLKENHPSISIQHFNQPRIGFDFTEKLDFIRLRLKESYSQWLRLNKAPLTYEQPATYKPWYIRAMEALSIKT